MAKTTIQCIRLKEPISTTPEADAAVVASASAVLQADQPLVNPTLLLTKVVAVA